MTSSLPVTEMNLQSKNINWMIVDTKTHGELIDPKESIDSPLSRSI